MSELVSTVAAAYALAEGRHGDPFSVLGPHLILDAEGVRLVIRVWQPAATEMFVLPLGADEPAPPLLMLQHHVPGFFEVSLANVNEPFAYRLRGTFGRTTVDFDDPYRFGPCVGELDRHLLGQGTHHHAYRRLGAHPSRVDGIEGTVFAVWAPNALRVSVVADFNGWDGRVHPMRLHPTIGVWEIFVPGSHVGERYKYEIRSRLGGEPFLKADPYAFQVEVPPSTASIVAGLPAYEWTDERWMASRPSQQGWLERPMSIYEVHLGSWMRRPDGAWLSYRELAQELVPYVTRLGFTHIELLPVMEHPFFPSWGYQVIGFFAPTSRYGSPTDFRAFVDECHRHGIGVILDWVPGHFPKDAHGLARFDGTALYEHADPRQGEHQDWGTLVFNYGRNEVRNFLLSNALFWLDQFHVDGLRVDAVASILYLDYSRKEGEWVPNKFGGRENLEAVEFLRELNTVVHGEFPGTVTIAEESTAWPAVSRPVYVGGLGFSFKWNMGWMHDILAYTSKDPIHRRWEHNHVTFSMLYAYNENFILPFSHDEVVHGKGSMVGRMPGDAWQKMANLRALYGFMFAHPGKKLLFMGCEIGQWAEWNHDAAVSWDVLAYHSHAGLQAFVRDLNQIYVNESALHELDYEPAGFTWIDCNDHENSVISFSRANRRGERMIVVVNFTPVPRHAYRVGVPESGRYVERLNSDAETYGGSNVGNGGWVDTEPEPRHGHAHSLSLTVPPLSVLMLKK